MPRRIAGSKINIDTAIENISCYASQNTFDNFKIRDAGLSKPRLHLHTLDERVQMLKKAISCDQAQNHEKPNDSEGT